VPKCLEQIVTHDRVREHTLTTRFAWHHGSHDTEERAFRGFGRVDQWDAEVAGHDDLTPVVPVRTTTWFHTGAWRAQQALEDAYAAEWFQADADAPVPEPHLLTTPTPLSPAERREAARALKGRMLRQEVWRDDGTVPGALLRNLYVRSPPLNPSPLSTTSACTLANARKSAEISPSPATRPQ
jgi:hypothetical protein